ncbi:MAG: hypothetical protein HND47_18000 [Chloroflexi bacterium]|nr:hypothetical protein [Chloroflexota bacterium]
MNKLFDALEVCLREIENGTDLETALARYPDLAGELRPILKTAVKMRGMSAPEPSSETARRGRARVMRRAAEIRESKRAPARRVIPVLPRLAISFALLIALLLSGTGILSASASALPGERLYPVKRGWENVRLFFIFDKEARELLANEFENERLHEIDELLAEGRHEMIQFAGVFMQVKDKTYVSGLRVVLPADIQAPENGAAVIVTGRTNAQGFIEVTSLELLPAGSIVPTGKPIEMESEDESGPAPASTPGDTGGIPAQYEIQGTLQAISANTLIINGVTVYISNLSTQGLCVGMTVEVTGYYTEDGRFIATRIKAEDSCPEEGGAASTPAPSQNDNSGSNENEGNENTNEDNGNDGNSNEDNGNEDNSNDGNGNDDDSNEDNGNGNDGGNSNDDDDDGGGGNDND